MLYLVFVCPDIRSVTHDQSGGSWERLLTVVEHEWGGDGIVAKAKVVWNRESDAITIGNDTFDRKLGNTFVIKVEGALTAYQIGVADPGLSYELLLDYVKSRTKHFSWVQGVEIDD